MGYEDSVGRRDRRTIRPGSIAAARGRQLPPCLAQIAVPPDLAVRRLRRRDARPLRSRGRLVRRAALPEPRAVHSLPVDITPAAPLAVGQHARVRPAVAEVDLLTLPFHSLYLQLLGDLVGVDFVDAGLHQ